MILGVGYIKYIMLISHETFKNCHTKSVTIKQFLVVFELLLYEYILAADKLKIYS